jgi:hypothetical protein
VCDDIGGAGGYAWIPDAKTSKNVKYQCIAMKSDQVEINTLAHEVGHHVGLIHTWGFDWETCHKDNDFVADTAMENRVSAYVPEWDCKSRDTCTAPGTDPW